MGQTKIIRRYLGRAPKVSLSVEDSQIPKKVTERKLSLPINEEGAGGVLSYCGRQFRIMLREEVSWVLSVMIRNRLPS